jgi:Tol biopolymer transport system component
MHKTMLVAVVAGLAFAGAGAAAAPDGQLIAFVDTRVDWELVVRQADGSGERRVASSLTYQLNPSFSPDGQWVAFESGGVGIEVARIDGSDRRPVASSGFDPSWSPDGRRIAWARLHGRQADLYVAAADGTGLTRLTNDPADEVEPGWSPDSRSIVFSRNGVIHELPADASAPARQLVSTRSDLMTSPRWSPDGRTLVMQAVSRSVKSPNRLFLARPEPRGPADPAAFVEGADPDWSTDGRVLFVRLGDLWSVRPDGSEARFVLPLRPKRVRFATLVGGWSQAAGRIAFGWDVGSRPQLYGMRPDGTGLRRLFERALRSPAFSPDGRRVASVVENTRSWTLVVTDLATGAARGLATVRRAVGAPSWAPNGRRLAFDTSDGVFTISLTGGKPRRVKGTTRADREPDWSPDGRAIAFTRRPHRRPDLHVVDLRTGRTRLLRRNAESPAWSPDGRRVAYTNGYVPTYNVDVWAVRRDGTQPRRLTRHLDFDVDPEWSPEGRRIAFISTRGVDTAPWLGVARIFVMRADRGERSARPIGPIQGSGSRALSWRG